MPFPNCGDYAGAMCEDKMETLHVKPVSRIRFPGAAKTWSMNPSEPTNSSRIGSATYFIPRGHYSCAFLLNLSCTCYPGSTI
ncbi:hypothetical protein ElyMa_000338500 [Elysia marginata]|uniref:EGF-like domain-containing protein n=1 Tax=Elysia marginata TaxID=1093978 RepID=A0AAV4FCC0_9GAST|nr:hypothetical protein ElyMa_000338500 [Elysia marginata]